MSRASFLAPFCLMSLLWDCWSTKAQLNSGSPTSLRRYLLKEWTTLSKDLIGTSWLTQPGCGSESNVLRNLLSSPRLKSTRNDGSSSVRRCPTGFFSPVFFVGSEAQRCRKRCFLSHNLSWRDTREPPAVRTSYPPVGPLVRGLVCAHYQHDGLHPHLSLYKASRHVVGFWVACLWRKCFPLSN